MKATYYIKDLAVSTDFFCIFDNIADSGVGTARNNYESCFCPVYECRVIRKEVRNFVSFAVLHISNSSLCLKSEVPGNLTKENEPLAQPEGST